MARRSLVAGNWKMNGLRCDLAEIREIREMVEAGHAGAAEVLICPPSTLIREAVTIAQGSRLEIGGQNCHHLESGAHTGDLAPSMLVDAGARYVILGHSERRADHGETNVLVRRKASTAMAAGLTAIICVGETKEERDAGRAQSVVGRQIHGSVPADHGVDRLVLAYEPIWAIGTGVTPTTHDVAVMHAFLRRELNELFGEAGSTVRVLYGGSVKPGNAVTLMGIADVDGALVGGASLTAGDFMGIAAAYRSLASVQG